MRRARLGMTVRPSVIAPTVPSLVTVSGDPGRPVLLFVHSQPQTQYRLVRRGLLRGDGTVAFSAMPSTNTRLSAAYSGQTGVGSTPLVLRVRTA